MNDLLQLKGRFQHNKARQPGPVELPAWGQVPSEKLRSLSDDLSTTLAYWERTSAPFNPLVSAYYSRVVPKTSRIRRLLGGSKSASDFIVGAKFAGDEYDPRHVITYCVDLQIIKDTIELLNKCADVVDKDFDGCVYPETLKRVNAEGLKTSMVGLTKTAFAQCMRDTCFVERFGVESAPENISGETVVTLYDTGYDSVIEFMHDLGFSIEPDRILGNAVRLYPEEYRRLVDRYPSLVSMAVVDINEMEPEDYPVEQTEVAKIPAPGSEPIIGVIDTPFYDGVYFSEWVESHDEFLLEALKGTGDNIEMRDRMHGTSVTSLVVDGPHINPSLDDGCGRFRVRHFGVAKAGRFSSFSVMRSVDAIVRENRDIKVWNISLGSMLPVGRNFISPEAAILDDLQSEFDDIVFVVAGTNQDADGNPEKIGAPADSINSIVVNATGFDGKIASYSRKGPVLSFFKKPDVCCVGGELHKGVHVCTPAGESWRPGTSYAAPWIARKMAYLMQIMDLPREVAKALIIDSAAGWTFDDNPYTGYGRVPEHIESILGSANDEIRFVLTGISDEYETYNYNIPVPINKGGYPYVARATLCYFPYCDRRQGVDYTSTEMDLHFGRINNKGKIQPLNKNPQGEQGSLLYESDARRLYRKWDNVKHIGEELKSNARSRTTYETGMWGLKIRTTERGDEKMGRGLKFGVIVTLKEINGVNRIDQFIQQCSLRGWLVTRIDVQSRVDIFNAAEVDIDFGD